MTHRIQQIVRCTSSVHDHLHARGWCKSKRKTQMKKLIATLSVAAGLAAVIASPALAQSGKHRHQVRAPYAASNPYAAYAAAPYGSYRPARPSVRGSYSVYDIRGNRIGSDPDATVRDQLAHDPTQGD
jgi:hypothetical protein